MKKRIPSMCVCLLALLLCLCTVPEATHAAGSSSITAGIQLQYGQTEAREMLQMVNAFRTNPEEAWAWAQDNQTKTQYTNLQPLQYDYELEKIAMLRAAEVALSHSHTRPNGTDCFSAYQNYPSTGRGENIAAGYSTSAAVFEGWQETDEPYDGQGHRRNMLQASFQTIGIGHVYYNGMHYWVQEFAKTNTPNTTATPANDQTETVPLEILPSNMSNLSLTCTESELAMTTGEKLPLPELGLSANISGHFPSHQSCPLVLPEDTSADSPRWTSSAPNIVTVTADGMLSASAAGTATLSATWNGLNTSCKVTVQDASSSSSGNTSGTDKQTNTQADSKVPDVTLKTVKNNAKGAMKITWKKAADVSGYQITYSANQSFKASKIKNANGQSVSTVVKGLQTGKAWYVRVRAYRRLNGKVFYGDWSNGKKVVIRK